MPSKADSPTQTCTAEGCVRPLRARGLCISHYNKQDPNRHPRATVACDGCGEPITRDDRAARYAGNYCSSLCQHWHKYGTPMSSALPMTHWARMYGATSTYTPPRTIACAWCAKAYTTKKTSQRFCCMNHKRKAKAVRRRGREFGATGEYAWSDLVRLWLLFDKQCAYCSALTDLADTQAEHVHPLSRGGRNDIGNLLPSCGPCNSDKRDLLLPEWNPDRARRHLDPVTTTWTRDDARYRHLVNTRSIVGTQAA